MNAVRARDAVRPPMAAATLAAPRPPRAEDTGWVRDPRVRVVRNPAGGTSAGLNASVRAAAHDALVRLDARCRLPPDYVRLAVATLERSGAINVGGRLRPVGHGPFERAVGLVMTTRLGAGGYAKARSSPEPPEKAHRTTPWGVNCGCRSGSSLDAD